MICFIRPYPESRKGMTAFCKEYSLNSIYAGKHWTKRKADKEYWRLLVLSELKRQKIKPQMLQEPVEIVFTWNDHLDCSNHAYMGKMIEDCLVGYLLHDDNRRYVKRIVHQFHEEHYIKIEVKESGGN